MSEALQKNSGLCSKVPQFDLKCLPQLLRLTYLPVVLLLAHRGASKGWGMASGLAGPGGLSLLLVVMQASTSLYPTTQEKTLGGNTHQL